MSIKDYISNSWKNFFCPGGKKEPELPQQPEFRPQRSLPDEMKEKHVGTAEKDLRDIDGVFSIAKGTKYIHWDENDRYCLPYTDENWSRFVKNGYCFWKIKPDILRGNLGKPQNIARNFNSVFRENMMKNKDRVVPVFKQSKDVISVWTRLLKFLTLAPTFRNFRDFDFETQEYHERFLEHLAEGGFIPRKNDCSRGNAEQLACANTFQVCELIGKQKVFRIISFFVTSLDICSGAIADADENLFLALDKIYREWESKMDLPPAAFECFVFAVPGQWKNVQVGTDEKRFTMLCEYGNADDVRLSERTLFGKTTFAFREFLSGLFPVKSDTFYEKFSKEMAQTDFKDMTFHEVAEKFRCPVELAERCCLTLTEDSDFYDICGTEEKILHRREHPRKGLAKLWHKLKSKRKFCKFLTVLSGCSFVFIVALLSFFITEPLREKIHSGNFHFDWGFLGAASLIVLSKTMQFLINNLTSNIANKFD